MRTLLYAMLLSCSSALGALDGKTLYTQKLCHTCHGAEGKQPIAPNYPKNAGQSAVYCTDQTKLIRDGKRTSGMAVVMKGMVATVKDEEVQAICAYLATVQP